MEQYINLRANMVDCQLRPNQVRNLDLIEAFLSTPREIFVSSSDAPLAYADCFLRLSPERIMMPPMLLGRGLQECHVTKTDIILDVACGRGYGCAILSKLASTVVGVENNLDLMDLANKTPIANETRENFDKSRSLLEAVDMLVEASKNKT